MKPRRSALRARYLLVPALLFACGNLGQSTGTAPENGGVAGSDDGESSGGTAGTGGSAAAGSGGSYNQNYPPSCIRSLVERCSIAEPCIYENHPETKSSVTCSDNGVRVESETTGLSVPGDCPKSRTAIDVYASDGSLCYTQVLSLAADCTTSLATWLDPEGNTLATGSNGYGEHEITCADREFGACAGPACKANDDGPSASCEPGVCPDL